MLEFLSHVPTAFLVVFLIVASVPLAMWLLGIRYIPHDRVGIVERYWSARGSLSEGRIIALEGEAGFQADVLRGGLHLFYFSWVYRIHRQPLVAIPEGKIGYLYARDGEPLAPTQTLGQVVDCNHFQDARAFLENGGQRGRQRGILREGVYAMNLALFGVISEDAVYPGPFREPDRSKYRSWQAELLGVEGFDPVVIAQGNGADARGTRARAEACATGEQDSVGVVCVHDGPPIETGEVIAPLVTPPEGEAGHDYFQDPERFLALGGRRGMQLQVLTDGTFFLNGWFATVELKPKTIIPIGYVGVVVSYHGVKGEDLTGDSFRYGEQVEPGHRGVWRSPLPPGKYALNPYALKVELVPTVNFVLRWVTGMTEEHHYDKDLTSIALITADGYEPTLPLSLVLHIDYEKAPRVVQRFGDVRRLISQTLDPILAAYFRDVAQSTCMLDLLTKREEIQRRATQELGRRFQEYDINCVSVLIGRPESPDGTPAAEDPIERLYDQLRLRRLAEEQVRTFAKEEEAALKLRELEEARAAARKQTELTQSRVDVDIAANRGSAQLAEAERLARRDVALAQGQSEASRLLGRGEASRIAQTGLAEAAVFLKKIRAYGDSRLFALNLVGEQLARSAQPLVPERLLVMGGDGGPEPGSAGATGVFGRLIALLLSEKAGLGVGKGPADEADDLERFARELVDRVTRPDEDRHQGPPADRPAATAAGESATAD